jgi:uncharacterized membrane protein (UPF0127 family)
MGDKVFIGDNAFDTMVAITKDEQQQGLMHKPWPPPIMSFPFERPALRKFWMKNTISPLDIIFCNNGRVVGICDGEPLSTACVGPERMSNLVIEMPRGMVKKCGISEGDSVEIEYSIRSLAKIVAKRLNHSDIIA